MSEWLGKAVSRAEQISDWLSPQRQASLALLREAQWPSRKTEAWKYTPVHVLADAEFATAANSELVVAETIEGLNSIELVFTDGVLQSDLSQLPEGLSIVSLADAAAETQQWAAETFTAAKPARHLFGLVNDVLATAGVIIDVAEGVSIEPVVRIVHRVSKGCEAHNRVLVRIADQSSLTVVEDFSGEQKSFNTGFAEYTLGESASLEHYRFALQTGAALSVGGSHFNLATKAQLNSTLVGFGSELSRLDVDVNHTGEHAFAKLNAIYLLDGNELFDLHSTIEHMVPNGTTEENVRGIVADHSRAVFNGRIHIHRDAQKTLAELNNRNLLMSRDAEINTKPELEIYADDVRCAHGATIAEIDKGALYYLQSRGVSKAQAQIMLSFGFINELVDQMPNQVLAEWLRPQLRQRFANMEVK
ncbi:Fe-S cluster assembly protein SufD [Oceanicoccus sagamiensis]|uniref:Fe-S cluster assembly protein SufD n=1 Tax=Oceanicoccus sagamiensis TaxID=716816 RepID=A0A1X9NG82_9GAMM|nr:Fe-S cluster assembly protein SufD [Oceanicoccus sagamiensis]ARN76044.1 Fe-S cluster assembly protein SufD [Oceanicoccus sagamiensis]